MNTEALNNANDLLFRLNTHKKHLEVVEAYNKKSSVDVGFFHPPTTKSVTILTSIEDKDLILKLAELIKEYKKAKVETLQKQFDEL